MVLVTAIALAVAATLSQSISAQPQCPANPSPQTWYVRSGADPMTASGTRERPLPSLREAVRCAEEGAEIRILTSDRGSSDLSEVALVGPGKMMAQGNYWGDRSPQDGLGDALGDCSRLNWSDEEPIHIESDARCELWHVSGRPDPMGIDGRFHLVRDPAR